MHSDHLRYIKLTQRSRIEKSLNSLLGIIEGIAIDSAINVAEIGFLQAWITDHQEVQQSHPFNELIPLIKKSTADGVLTQDERDDIVWLCERLKSSEYHDQTTTDIQRLHAILGGIVADGHISEKELLGLSQWIQDHEQLKTCWPYDEVDSIVTAVMADGHIDEQEHRLLKGFFSEFVALLDDRTIVNPLVLDHDITLNGICAVCPEIKFEGSRFCFTGASTRYPRTTLADIVSRLGGEVSNSISAKVNYLVIGADGNPCWAYACYGRKVERAVELRKSGTRIVLVHENDFHDAVADII